MWATDNDHNQAHATRPQSYQFRCPGNESNADFFDMTPVPAPSTQWWYPEGGVTGWDGADSESQYSSRPPSGSTDIGLPADGGPTPSASSSTAGVGMTDLWHGPTPPMCDVPSTGMDSAMYTDGSSWAEQFMTTGLETSPEFSWSDNAVFEPYVASQRSESIEPQRVRHLLQVTIYKHPFADLPCRIAVPDTRRLDLPTDTRDRCLPATWRAAPLEV